MTELKKINCKISVKPKTSNTVDYILHKPTREEPYIVHRIETLEGRVMDEFKPPIKRSGEGSWLFKGKGIEEPWKPYGFPRIRPKYLVMVVE